MKLRQYKLRSVSQPFNGTFREMTVWLEDGRAKIGDSVTLKDTDEPNRLWEICEAYGATDNLKDHRDFGESIQGRGSLRD